MLQALIAQHLTGGTDDRDFGMCGRIMGTAHGIARARQDLRFAIKRTDNDRPDRHFAIGAGFRRLFKGNLHIVGGNCFWVPHCFDTSMARAARATGGHDKSTSE